MASSLRYFYLWSIYLFTSIFFISNLVIFSGCACKHGPRGMWEALALWEVAEELVATWSWIWGPKLTGPTSRCPDSCQLPSLCWMLLAAYGNCVLNLVWDTWYVVAVCSSSSLQRWLASFQDTGSWMPWNSVLGLRVMHHPSLAQFSLRSLACQLRCLHVLSAYGRCWGIKDELSNFPHLMNVRHGMNANMCC